MRLVSLDRGEGPEAALLSGDRVVPLAALDPALPRELTAIVRGWPSFRERLRELDPGAAEAGVPAAAARLTMPFAAPRILGTGGNYAEHLGEMRAAAAAAPSAFAKLPGSALGPGEPLPLDPGERCVDYEGELALVVGAPARDVDAGEAADLILGLMLANDVSARDVPTPHITLAKGSRGFCPLGPWLVTADELDLGHVAFAVAVNGEPRQAASTETMIHSFAEILASYSRAIPLEPGDVILTGTPGGVGISQQPPRFLAPGDEIVVSSPQLGTLRTPVV